MALRRRVSAMASAIPAVSTAKLHWRRYRRSWTQGREIAFPSKSLLPYHGRAQAPSHLFLNGSEQPGATIEGRQRANPQPVCDQGAACARTQWRGEHLCHLEPRDEGPEPSLPPKE